MSTTDVEAPGAPPAVASREATRGRLSQVVKRVGPKYATTVFLVVMFAFFAAENGKRFYSTDNISNILGQSSILGIVACGLTIPLIINSFDLSVGWAASFAGVLAATLAVNHGTVYAIAVTLAAGIAIGIVNGLVVSRLKVSSLIATLGMGAVLVGLAQKVNNSVVAGLPDDYTWLGQHKVGTIPVAAILMLILGGLLWVMATQTPLGRSMYAIGGSREASRLAGIRIGRITIVALAISGMMAALGGIILSSTVASGQPGAGDSLLLDGFTAAAIGTVTFRRGEYNVMGTVLAVLLLTTMLNGMTMIGWEPYWQNIVKGVILVAAVGASVGGGQDR